MQSWHRLVVMGVTLGVVGCGTPRRDGPETVPVTIQVLYNGQPVEGATVSLIGDVYSSSGVTDARGTARPWTFDPGDGVAPGSYRATVRKVEVVQTLDPNDPSPDGKPTMKPLSEEVVRHLPERYGSPSDSGLSADVVSDGPNEFTFELTN